jgi:FkbM family methyltransferase
MKTIICKIIYELYVLFFARTFWYKLNIFLYNLSIRGLGVLNYENNKKSGERFFLEKLLHHNSHNHDDYTIVDVGANVGNYALSAKSINSNVIIYAIEPMPNTYQVLTANVSGTNGISTYNMAIGEQKGKLAMYDYGDENSSHASIYKEVITDIHSSQKVKEFFVDVVSLDEFCAVNQIENINLLKIDTEGHEYSVLLGAKRMLEEKRIEVIQFEFNEMNVVSKVFFRDFIHLLNDYKLYRLLPSGVLPVNEYIPVQHELFAFQNIVAVKNDMNLFC